MIILGGSPELSISGEMSPREALLAVLQSIIPKSVLDLSAWRDKDQKGAARGSQPGASARGRRSRRPAHKPGGRKRRDGSVRHRRG